MEFTNVYIRNFLKFNFAKLELDFKLFFIIWNMGSFLQPVTEKGYHLAWHIQYYKYVSERKTAVV